MVLGPSRCPIYLKLPWLDRKCQLLADRISASAASCYNAVKLRTVFQTRSAYPSLGEGRLFYFLVIFIYKFKCRCDTMYIGRTNQRLETQITQHVPAYLGSSSESRDLRTPQAVHDFSIGQHLLDNPDCVADYDDAFFPFYIVLARFTISKSLRLFTSNFISRVYINKRNILFVPYV